MRTHVSYSLVEKLVRASGKGLAVLTLSWYFGPVYQGYFATLIAASVIAVLIVIWGLELSNNYHSAIDRNRSQLPALLGNTLLFVLVSGAIGQIVLRLVINSPLLDALPERFHVYLLVMVPIASLFLSLGGIVYGLGWFGLRACGTLVHLYGFLITLGLVIVFQWKFEVALASWVVAQGLAVCLFVVCLLHETHWSLRVDFRLLKSQLRYGSQSLLFLVLMALIFRLDHLMIGWLAGAAAVGVYSIAAAATEVLLYFPKALGTVALTQRSNGTPVSPGFLRGSGAMLVILGSAASVVGPTVIALVLPAEFGPAGVALLVLLPGTIALGSAWIANYDLLGQGRVSPGVAAALTAVVTTVVLDLALIPRFGVIGAAVASSVAYVAFSGVTLTFFTRTNGVPILAIIRPDFRGVGREVSARVKAMASRMRSPGA
jgi:O-antigen/teichoic acid export membrane protein